MNCHFSSKEYGILDCVLPYIYVAILPLGFGFSQVLLILILYATITLSLLNFQDWSKQMSTGQVFVLRKLVP